MTSDRLRLNMTNYHSWRPLVKGRLVKEEVWELVNPDTPEVKGTEDEESLALTALADTIDPVVLERFNDLSSARALLMSIDSTFKARTITALRDAQKLMHSLSLSKCQSLQDYVDKMMGAFATISNAGKTKMDDEDKKRILLDGIDPPEFDGFKNTHSENPALSFDALTAMVLRLVYTPPRTHRANAVVGRPPQSCPACGGDHWRSDCPNAPETRSCYFCKKRGHVLRNCPDLRNGSNKASSSCYSRTPKWTVDSGATISMTADKKTLVDYEDSSQRHVEMADGTKLAVAGQGLIKFGRKDSYLMLPALHVPELKHNLIAVGDITAKEAKVVFEGDSSKVIANGAIIAEGKKEEAEAGLYQITNQCLITRAKDVAEVERVTMMELHKRLAHLSPEYIRRLIKHNLINGYELVDEEMGDCPTCRKAKMTRLPHANIASRVTERVGEIVSADIVGPMPVPSINGESYISHIVDHYSSWSSTRCLKEKSAQAVLGHVQDFVDFLSNQCNAKVKILRTDGGTEYDNERMAAYLGSKGIHHEIVPPYSPRGNGKVERRNRTLLETLRSMLKEGGLSSTLWGEAAKAATFILNRTLTSNVPGITAFEVIFGYTPELKGVKVFGSKCWVYNERQGNKLDDRAKFGIMVGYSTDNPGAYRILLKGTKKVLTSRNVKFVDDNDDHMMDVDEFTDLTSVEELNIDQLDHSIEDSKTAHQMEGVVMTKPRFTNTPAFGAPLDTDSKAKKEQQTGPQPKPMEDTETKHEENDMEPPTKETDAETKEDKRYNCQLEPQTEIQEDPSEAHINTNVDVADQPTTECNEDKVEGKDDDAVPTSREPTPDVTETAVTESIPRYQLPVRSTRYQGSYAPEKRPYNTTKRGKRKLSIPTIVETVETESTIAKKIKPIEEESSCDIPTDIVQTFEDNPLAEETERQMDTGDAIDSFTLLAKAARPQWMKPPEHLLTVRTALNGEEGNKWQEAIGREVTALVDNDTWDYCYLPEGRSAVGSRFVLTKKLAAGTHEMKHKARLVAQGFSQIANVDYFETFAPVTRIETVLLLLAIAAHKRYLVHHVDFNNAYLNASLQETIYMRQPHGYPLHEDPKVVLRLKKSLYGLKQAGREWHLLLRKTLQDLGWTPNSKDQCLFTRKGDDDIEHLLVYVDDLLIAASCESRVDIIKAELKEAFLIKDLGPISYFLGIKVRRSSDLSSFYLSQPDMIGDLIDKFKLGGQNRVTTAPILKSMELGINEEEANDNMKFYYSSLVGSLLYIARCSRPDIAFAVSVCSRFQKNPGKSHIALAERIARYLHSSSGHELKIEDSGTMNLTAYSDADWAGDKVDFASTSGMIVQLGASPILWSSKKQSCISLSTTQAEYIAMSDCCRDLLVLNDLLLECGYEPGVPKLKCDSKAALKIAENDHDHRGSKHINVRFHYVRDEARKGHLSLKYVESSVNLADGFTKALPVSMFKEWTRELGIAPPEIRGMLNSDTSGTQCPHSPSLKEPNISKREEESSHSGQDTPKETELNRPSFSGKLLNYSLIA